MTRGPLVAGRKTIAPLERLGAVPAHSANASSQGVSDWLTRFQRTLESRGGRVMLPGQRPVFHRLTSGRGR